MGENERRILVWTFCTPPCGTGETSHPTWVKDLNNIDGHKGTFPGVTDWVSNHAKLGYCLSTDYVIISGWNHSPPQISRGSSFVAIESKQLRQSFGTMFHT